ncbi:MAG: polysaccharide pyruvyl transferase family protein [Siphonobacter sp.]
MNAVIYPSRIKTSNLGDVLINVLLIRELSKHTEVYLDGEIKEINNLLTVNNPFSKNIKVIRGLSLFNGKPIVRWLNLFKVINRVGFVFDPPGSYAEGLNKNKFLFKYYKYYLRARLLKLFGIKVYRWGVSFGDFSLKGYNLQRKLSMQYGNIAVRDSNNFAKLKNIGFNNLSLIEDLAFLYNPENFKDLLTLREIKDKYIVLSFRSDIEGSRMNMEYLDKLIIKITQIIKSNFYKDYSIVLSYQVEEDLPVLRLIHEALNEISIKSKIIEKQLTFSEAISLYYNASFVFSNRLHVALLAFLNNTVSLIITDIENHHKLVNIYNDLQLNELIIDCDNNLYDCNYINNQNEFLQKFNDSTFIKREVIINHIQNFL